MSLSGQELADVVAEISVPLEGARLRKLNAPTPRTCQLVFATREGQRVLLLDLTPGRTRLHLIGEKRPAPRTPPALVMKCRQEIEGGILGSISKDADERVVRLVFRDRTLLAELFGRRGRLLLLDESLRVLFALIGRATAGQPYRVEKSTRTAAASSRFPERDPQTLAVNRAVEAHYRESDIDDLRLELARLVAGEKKRLERRLLKMKEDLDQTAGAQSLSRQGEALKVNLHKVKKGQKQITLQDPYDPGGDPVTVHLDPALDAKENMKRLFARGKRMSAARPKIEERILQTEEDLEIIDGLSGRVEDAASLSDLYELEDSFAGAGVARPKTKAAKKPQRRLPYKVYRSAQGLRILVGRSGRDNNELTFQVAKGSDLWLHARNTPGAHVVVPLKKGQEADEQTLLDAATLAAASSGQKQDQKVEVTYTKAKNVHPIKGAPPGLVSVAKGRTILIRMEPERLERLKKSLKIQA
jgi:predicted ribosome quality control (RQC) complex YloA/Tae2 family protein